MIMTAPGCKIYSREATAPSGSATVSRTACKNRPLKSSSLLSVFSIKWMFCMGVNLPVPVCEQIAVYKPGKSKCQKKRSGDGVKLPALRRDLPNLIFKQQTHATYQQVKHKHFDHAKTQRLWLRGHEKAQDPCTGKWKVGPTKAEQHDKPHRNSLGHSQ